jgi:hypothetical protein
MSKQTLIVAASIVVIAGAACYYFCGQMWSGSNNSDSLDYKNTTYAIEGTQVKLVNGESVVEAAPGSASKITTKYFGNVAKGDLNGDTIPDLAFLLTQNTGGSGTFYYVVVAIQNKDGSYSGSNAKLIGDRIAPQTTEISGNKITVNYANRKPGEPMTAQPTVGESAVFTYSNNQLREALGD